MSLAGGVNIEHVVLAAETGVHRESQPAVAAVQTAQR